MKLKKNIAKAIAVAMILGVSVSSNAFANLVPVQAAVIAASGITVNYTDYTLSVTGNSADKYIFVEVLKDEKGEKVSATYCYAAKEGKVENIDLSFLKAAKAQYIRVYGDATTEKSDVITINAQPGKLKIKYAPKYKEGKLDSTASLTVTEGKTEVKFATDAAKYEYRTLYGSNFTKFSTEGTGYLAAGGGLEKAIIAGTTLIVRKAADETAKTPAGPETKVKIAAIPKAPKVTVDYVKGTVKVAKGTEWSLDGTTYKAFSAASYTVDDFLKEVGKTGALATGNLSVLIRTAATEKKAASAISFLTLDKLLTATKTADTNEVLVKDGDTQVGKLTWESTETGVTVKAEGCDFQYTLDGEKKAKVVKAGATANVKLSEGKKVVITSAGVKDDAKKEIDGRLASEAPTDTIYFMPKAKTPEVKTDGQKVTVTSGDKTLTLTVGTADAATVAGDTAAFEMKKDSSTAAVAGNAGTTIEVRVKAVENKLVASDYVKVTLPAKVAEETK